MSATETMALQGVIKMAVNMTIDTLLAVELGVRFGGACRLTLPKSVQSSTVWDFGSGWRDLRSCAGKSQPRRSERQDSKAKGQGSGAAV